MGAVILGNGSSGVILVILRAISLAIFPHKEDEYYSARLYFTFSALILVLGIAGYFYIRNHKLVIYFKNKAHKAQR